MVALASISQASYTPIALTSSSYNADVIVESNATPTLTVVTSASIDNGTNNYANTLFEEGFDTANPTHGLPPHGSTFTSMDNANFSFQMAPSYTAPNGILIDAFVTNGTFTLVTPQKYTEISILGLGGNGGDQMTAVVHHQDGTTETGPIATADWFGGTTGIAVIMGGRCNSTVNLTTEVDGTSGDGLGNPRVYHRELTLTNTASPVTSVELEYLSGSGGSHSDVMALSGAVVGGSGAVAPIAVTGYDYDFVVESNAPMNGRIVSQTVVDSTNVWATDQSMDSDTDTGNTWYEQGYNLNNDDSGTYNNPNDNLTGTGLPHPGDYITNSALDHVYQMAPSYVGPDAIYINDQDAYTNATITLATPTAYSGLSFLGAAGNGPVVVNYTINYQGGTTQTGVLSIADWFDGNNATFIANGRVAVDTAQFGGVNNGDPILHQNDIVLTDTTDPVVSINLQNTNGVSEGAGFSSGRFSIFAVSGNVGALPPIISQQPASVNNYVGTSVTFTSTATANAPITYQWQKGTNGVYVNVSNGSEISGATTTVLSVNPIGFNDAADYRIVATDSAGQAFSGVGTLRTFSTNLDVTEPGDPISGVNISQFGDGSPTYAIDNSMDTKFGANINSGAIAGLIVTPAAGLTVVSGLRIYTGSDTVSRDPASYELEGSTDGGHTYTIISSNAIALSDNRNPLTAGEAPDPLTQYCTEVDFSNTVGYTTYKILFPTEKGTGQIQFDEMELLGTNDTSAPYFSPQPFDQKVFNGGSAEFSATPVFNPTPTVSWFKGTNGVYVALANGGNISGVATPNLSVNPATFADSADYVAVANSSAGYVTSSIAHLYVYTTNVDVSQPGDTITEFGDTTGTRYSPNNDPSYVIDNTFSEWENGGSGFSAGAGFPPFGGPVGVVLTPSVGSTVLTGLRIYPGQDAADNDPSGFVLEGSNDGGTNYTTITSGPLSLPLDRNSLALAVDPTQAAVQEVLFANTQSYTTYRLTFPNVRSPSTASYLEIGDAEFLGVPAVTAPPLVISHTSLSGGNLSITGSGGTANGSFSVLTNATLTVPVASWGVFTTGTFDGSGNFSISLPVSAANPHLFYLIKTQ